MRLLFSVGIPPQFALANHTFVLRGAHDIFRHPKLVVGIVHKVSTIFQDGFADGFGGRPKRVFSRLGFQQPSRSCRHLCLCKSLCVGTTQLDTSVLDVSGESDCGDPAAFKCDFIF